MQRTDQTTRRVRTQLIFHGVSYSAPVRTGDGYVTGRLLVLCNRISFVPRAMIERRHILIVGAGAMRRPYAAYLAKVADVAVCYDRPGATSRRSGKDGQDSPADRIGDQACGFAGAAEWASVVSMP